MVIDMDRESQVLAVVTKYPYQKPSVITRLLTLKSFAKWAPVLPPKPDEQCAVVPRASREKVRRVLDRLVAKGQLVKLYPGTRMSGYALPPEE